jgi:hypothetical protein
MDEWDREERKKGRNIHCTGRAGIRKSLLKLNSLRVLNSFLLGS